MWLQDLDDVVNVARKVQEKGSFDDEIIVDQNPATNCKTLLQE